MANAKVVGGRRWLSRVRVPKEGAKGMGDFDGRVAIVTGGTRGIGAAVTTSLAEGGAHVAAGYHRGHEAAERFRRAASDRGLSVSTPQGNVGNPEDCDRVASDVLRERGRIDLLITTPGVTVDKTVLEVTTPCE